MERAEPETIETIMARRIMSMPEFKSELRSMMREELRRELDSKHLTREFFTTKELASHLKIKEQTIYSHVRKGLLKPECPGRNMRFSFEAVQNYLR